MPCYTPEPTPQEMTESNRNSNKEKYGFHMTNSELIAHLLNMCCEMGRELEAEGIEHRLSRATYDWYVNHKKRDEEKRKAEIQDRLQTLRREEKEAATKLDKIDIEMSKLQAELALL